VSTAMGISAGVGAATCRRRIPPRPSQLFPVDTGAGPGVGVGFHSSCDRTFDPLRKRKTWMPYRRFTCPL